MQRSIRRLRAAFGFSCLALPVWGATVGAEPVRQPPQPLASEALATFLKTHKGPVLDVSYASDCTPKLASTTHRQAFDHDHVDPDVQRAAGDMFVDAIRRSRWFVQANRNQTPVLVVCCGGTRSMAAARAMARMGFNVVTLDGGIASDRIPARLLAGPNVRAQ